MTVLEFQLINSYEKDQFSSIFGQYLEEITLTVGDSIEQMKPLYREYYNKYFTNNVNYQPFKIFYNNPDSSDPEQISIYAGFFFLNIITPTEIPARVKKILPADKPVAYLTEFYIFPDYRHRKWAWEFYHSIVRMCQENGWNCAWECDVRNEPAIGFYAKLLERIKNEFAFNVAINTYKNPRFKNSPYYYYQVCFNENS